MGGELFWNSFAITIALVAVLGVLTVSIQRDMRRPGTKGSVHGDPFGAMEEVFHPAAHRAREELRHWDEVSDTVPSPDGDDPTTPGGLTLIRAADGTPRSARFRRRR